MENYIVLIAVFFLVIAAILVIFLTIKWFLKIQEKFGRLIPFPTELDGYNAYYEMVQFADENKIWQIIMIVTGFTGILLLGIYK